MVYNDHTTHQHACYCRDAQVAALKAELAALQEERDALQSENEQLKEKINRISIYEPKMPKDIRGFSMKGGK